MPTPTGPGLNPADIRRDFATVRKDIDQIKRQVAKLAKPAPPGGGIEGITRVSAWSLSTTLTATNVRAAPTGTFDITARAGTAPAVTQTTEGGTTQAVALAEGYYVVTMDYYLGFSGTPPVGGRVWIDYSGSDYHFPQQISAIIPDVVGTSPGDLTNTWTVGPLPVVAPGILRFGASWPGSNTSAFVNYWSLDIAKVSGA